MSEELSLWNDTPIRQAILGSVADVTDEQGEFVGLVTERDIANWVATTEDVPEKTPISEIMTDQVVSCTPGTPSGEVREIMSTHRIRHLPIVEDCKLVGIISIGDLMKAIVSDNQRAIGALDQPAD